MVNCATRSNRCNTTVRRLRLVVGRMIVGALMMVNVKLARLLVVIALVMMLTRRVRGWLWELGLSINFGLMRWLTRLLAVLKRRRWNRPVSVYCRTRRVFTVYNRASWRIPHVRRPLVDVCNRAANPCDLWWPTTSCR